MNNVFLILGGNLGERRNNLAKALKEIGKTGAVIKKASSIYETEPWGAEGQPNYYNQVIEVLTETDASSLMQYLLTIEKKMGRERSVKYGARTIDIDILFFNSEVIQNDTVIIPHPRLHQRKFVLVPMVEIAPELIHPVLQKTMAALLTASNDTNVVKKIY